jgi:hypothetical protein
MSHHHEEVVIPDLRMAAATLRSSMNIYIFAKNVVRADREKRVLAMEFQILWRQADRGVWKKAVVCSDGRGTFDDYVRLQPASGGNPNAFANPAVGTDEDVCVDLRFGADNGGGVNHREKFRIANCEIRI